MKAKPKFPTIKELRALFVALKKQIGDEYRASDDPQDDTPGMYVTIGNDPKTGAWTWQTGDNSYTGGAYGSPDWAVVSLYRRSDSAALAREAIDQLADLAYGSGDFE